MNDIVPFLNSISYALHEMGSWSDAGSEDEHAGAEPRERLFLLEGMDSRSAPMKGEMSEGLRKKNWMVKGSEEAWPAWIEEGSGVSASSDEESGEAMAVEGPF